MSRPLRIQYAGAWYHVMNRGQNRRRIFHNDSQHHLFLELLSDINTRYGVQTHAYCLMDNHYHLLLHTAEANLSRAMRHLDSLYTQRFNRLEKRDGPLFRGRYKAILINAEHYGLTLSRYIHLNPVSAKVCLRPEDYPWSSYKAYLRQEKRPAWLYCDEMLLRCSERSPIKMYRKFMADGVDINLANVFAKKRCPSILGDRGWIEQIKEHCAEDLKVHEEIPASKELIEWVQKDDIHGLMQQVADYYEITLTTLKKPAGRHMENKARKGLIHLAVMHYGYKNKIVAEALGNISSSGVAQINGRVQKKLENDKMLQVELENLRRRCF